MQASQAPASSLHSKVEAASVAAKVRLALVARVVPEGPALIEVSGGVVSEATCARCPK